MSLTPPSREPFVVNVLARAFCRSKPKEKRLCRSKALGQRLVVLAQPVAAHGRIARVGLLAVGVASAVSAVGSVGLQLVHTLDGGIELKA